MTTTLDPAITIPPADQWTLGRARWGDGGVLESGRTNHEVMLVSPPQHYAAPWHYAIRVTFELLPPDSDAGTTGGAEPVESGVTVGLQDEQMKFWLKHANHTTPGPATVAFAVTVRRAGRFRVVLASCKPGRPAVTRVRDIRVEVVGSPIPEIMSDDDWKDEARRQWNTDHCGHDRGGGEKVGSLAYFKAIEKDRYESYAPWMPGVIGFEKYGGCKLLEIGGGLGTDHAQFAQAGAVTTDLDLAEGHLEMARRNFAARGLDGEFMVGDGETLPFSDESFDVVYSFGVIHHTPNTKQVVEEMHRVLKPGGEAIVMVYAKHSKYYWYNVVYRLWYRQGMRRIMSVDEVLSSQAEYSPSGAQPLVKVYTGRQCRRIFRRFSKVRVRKYQLVDGEVPRRLRQIASAQTWSRLVGWNLLVKAIK